MTEQEQFDAQFEGDNSNDQAFRDLENQTGGTTSNGIGDKLTNLGSNVFDRATNYAGNAASQYLSGTESGGGKKRRKKFDVPNIAQQPSTPPPSSGITSKTLLVIGGVVLGVVAIGAVLWSLVRGKKTA